MEMNEYLKKYPWLSGYDYGVENDEEKYCVLEGMPKGWRIAFGDLMLEDLDKAIKASHLENEFRIDELKEKYSELRIYYHPSTPEIDDIIRTYEQISSCVCEFCGSIEKIKVVPFGWVTSYCRKCYQKLNGDHNLDKFDALPDEELPTVVKWGQFSKNGHENFEMDISETVEKIRENYKKRIQKDEDENNG